jgi:hypothetical protein
MGQGLFAATVFFQLSTNSKNSFHAITATSRLLRGIARDAALRRVPYGSSMHAAILDLACCRVSRRLFGNNAEFLIGTLGGTLFCDRSCGLQENSEQND